MSPQDEQTRTQLRASAEQKARWIEAAGGPGKLSEWIRASLDRQAEVTLQGGAISRENTAGTVAPSPDLLDEVVVFATDGRFGSFAEAHERHQDWLEQEQADTALDAPADAMTPEALGGEPTEPDVVRSDQPAVVDGEAPEAPGSVDSSVDAPLEGELEALEEGSTRWLDDGEVKHLPETREIAPETVATFTLCGLDGRDMTEVDVPNDHAGIWCSKCLAALEEGPDGKALGDGLSEDQAQVAPEGSSSNDRLADSPEFAEHAFTERAFSDGEEDLAVTSTTRVIRTADDAKTALANLPESKTSILTQPYDFTHLDDDTNPEPEEPVVFPSMLEPAGGSGAIGTAPPTAPPPPPGPKLEPTCTNAYLHWKLTTGEHCRFCGGQA